MYKALFSRSACSRWLFKLNEFAEIFLIGFYGGLRMKEKQINVESYIF